MGCFNSVLINAPAEKVWSAIRDFHDLSWAPNVVEDVEKVGDIPGTQIGAKRVLNGAFQETLLGLDDNQRTLRYSIDDGPDAVSKDNVKGYVGRVQVLPVTDTNTTYISWETSWDSSGGGVQEFCDPIYQALLADLKKTFS